MHAVATRDHAPMAKCDLSFTYRIPSFVYPVLGLEPTMSLGSRADSITKPAAREHLFCRAGHENSAAVGPF